jgi:hypothetical protein
LITNPVRSGTKTILDGAVAESSVQFVSLYYTSRNRVAKLPWENYITKLLLEMITIAAMFERLSRLLILSKFNTLKGSNYLKMSNKFDKVR